MNILFIILLSLLLIGNIVWLIHYSGFYPFVRETLRPREGHFQLPSKYQVEKINTHNYQVLTGWTDLYRKGNYQKIYDSKDPAAALEKVIDQYQKDSSQRNFDVLIHLSNHISNRVRYDNKINALIERISEITNVKSKKV